MIQRYETLLTIFKNSNDFTIKILLKAFRCFEQKQFTEAKKVWFDRVQKSHLSESDQGNNCERNTSRSDSTFFEHLSRTPIAQTEVTQSKQCSNSYYNTAQKTTIRKTVRLLSLLKTERNMENAVRDFFFLPKEVANLQVVTFCVTVLWLINPKSTACLLS